MSGIKTLGREIYHDKEPFHRPLREQGRIIDKIVGTCNYFFSKSSRDNILPFRGFLIYGPPGSGKTELVKKVVYNLDKNFSTSSDIRVQLLFVDGGDIAAPKWGEGEKKLRDIFAEATSESEKRTILLFDDIETFILGRSAGLAKEWHFSLNSIFFHELDSIDLTKCIVIGTTNRNDLVDEALRSRFYSFFLDCPKIKDLVQIAKKYVYAYGLSDEILNKIEEKLKNTEGASIRTVEHYITDSIINRF